MYNGERKKKLIDTLKGNAKLRQERNIVTKTTQNNKNISAQTLWGRVVIYLREHNQVILHIVCGDLDNVSYEGEILVVWVDTQNIIDLLMAKENYNELKEAFESLGVTKFEIRLNKKVQEIEKTTQILKKYFDNNINIIKENK